MFLRLLLASFLFLAGCITSTGAVSKVKYNPKTGKYETMTYSRLFEGGGVLASDALELFVNASLEKDAAEAPADFLSKASDPNNLPSWAKADITLYFNSTASYNVNFSVDSVVYIKNEYRDELVTASQHIALIQQATEKIEIKGRPIINNAEDIILTVTYTYRSETKTKEIHLRRISNEELHQRKGKDWANFWS